MKKGFKPDEVLFSPSAACNLSCPHCDVPRRKGMLSARLACGFLAECKKLGIRRVGFTGGEPFLCIEFICLVSAEAVRQGFVFDRIMTNAVWWRDENDLKLALIRLFNSGYDGSICVSVDAFHEQSIKKVARFIEIAVRIWNRPDIVSIASVRGARDNRTDRMLAELKAQLRKSGRKIVTRFLDIGLSPVGRASACVDQWGDKWFNEDYCQGPGNVLFITPDGTVKPCCGYANHRSELSIGNIRIDSGRDIMNKFRNNIFAYSIFNKGLEAIRKKIERSGFKFRGKAVSHCFFCDHILTFVPRDILSKSLSILILSITLLTQGVFADELIAAKEIREIPVKVINKVSIPKGYHEGLFYDAGMLWLTNGDNGDIWKIDPLNGKVVLSIRPVSDFAEAFIKTADGAMLTTEWNTKKIYRVSVAGAALVSEEERSFDPAHPAGLIAAGDRIFVVTWTRGLGTKFHIHELDKDLNISSKRTIRYIQEPDQLAWDGEHLWISSWYSKAVYRIDVDRWEVSGYFKSPVSKTTGIAWDGKCMWLTGTYSDLYQVDIGK